jgi:hypothetical protein
MLFPTQLLTSEDEYKWYWHQMIYFPETINTISTLYTIGNTLSLVSSKLCTVLTLCMLASRSRREVVFLSLLSSSHFVTSCHVFPLPLSGLNWRSLFPPWGSWPSFLKMAPPSTGSAHPPFPGSGTHVLPFPLRKVWVTEVKFICPLCHWSEESISNSYQLYAYLTKFENI